MAYYENPYGYAPYYGGEKFYNGAKLKKADVGGSQRTSRNSDGSRASGESITQRKVTSMKILVFRNGDGLDDGIEVPCTKKMFPHWINFLDYLTSATKINGPVHRLFDIYGKEVTAFTEMENLGRYVAVSSGSFKKIKYGTGGHTWVKDMVMQYEDPSQLKSEESIAIYLKKQNENKKKWRARPKSSNHYPRSSSQTDSGKYSKSNSSGYQESKLDEIFRQMSADEKSRASTKHSRKSSRQSRAASSKHDDRRRKSSSSSSGNSSRKSYSQSTTSSRQWQRANFSDANSTSDLIYGRKAQATHKKKQKSKSPPRRASTGGRSSRRHSTARPKSSRKSKSRSKSPPRRASTGGKSSRRHSTARPKSSRRKSKSRSKSPSRRKSTGSTRAKSRSSSRGKKTESRSRSSSPKRKNSTRASSRRPSTVKSRKRT